MRVACICRVYRRTSLVRPWLSTHHDLVRSRTARCSSYSAGWLALRPPIYSKDVTHPPLLSCATQVRRCCSVHTPVPSCGATLSAMHTSIRHASCSYVLCVVNEFAMTRRLVHGGAVTLLWISTCVCQSRALFAGGDAGNGRLAAGARHAVPARGARSAHRPRAKTVAPHAHGTAHGGTVVNTRGDVQRAVFTVRVRSWTHHPGGRPL